jgi:hypothetical protein
MAEQNPGQKSKSVGETPEDRNRFALPTAREPLREWTPEDIGEEVILESMKLLTQAARSAPKLRGRPPSRKEPSSFHILRLPARPGTSSSLRKENPFHPDKKR